MNLLPLCLALLLGAEQKPSPHPRAELLIEAAELAQPGRAEQYHILDARPIDRYTAGHVPGAIQVDPAAWARTFTSSPDQATWTTLLGRVGIDTGTRVVVYDDNAAKDAARIWWILRYWGVRDVRLLNGGWKAWRGGGYPLSRDMATVAATKPALAPQEQRLAGKADILAALPEKRWQLVDTRSAGEHCGLETTAKRNGAIPGAVHLEWSEVLDPQTQRFKGPAELARVLQQAGVAVDRPTVTYCQSGGRAAVMAFALELVGARDVRNYYRSWSEWGNAEDTPIVKPAPKK